MEEKRQIVGMGGKQAQGEMDDGHQPAVQFRAVIGKVTAQHLRKNLINESIEIDPAVQIFPMLFFGDRTPQFREQDYKAVSLAQKHIVDAEKKKSALVEFSRTMTQQSHIL